MIEKIRTYIATCPYLNQYAELNINYLSDKTQSYSINEGVGYNPVVSKDIINGKEKQFLFNLDSRLKWSEEIRENIDNSTFFENFTRWIEDNNKSNVFPDIAGIHNIEVLTNGYIFATSANEAIYRIQCKLNYYKEE